MNNFEYSQSKELAHQLQETVAEIDQMIAEDEAYLRELREHRDQSVKDNEWAKEQGLREFDIEKIDLWIKEVEEAIERFKDYREKFLSLSGDFDQIHQQYVEFLNRAKINGKIN